MGCVSIVYGASASAPTVVLSFCHGTSASTNQHNISTTLSSSDIGGLRLMPTALSKGGRIVLHTWIVQTWLPAHITAGPRCIVSRYRDMRMSTSCSATLMPASCCGLWRCFFWSDLATVDCKLSGTVQFPTRRTDTLATCTTEQPVACLLFYSILCLCSVSTPA